ncbi:hypothetical protein [Gemmatimonas sp.]|uniref:hypothetical protein n=1 Tax=Gemmatimonas sp. TaxID=1962908 RepID=UPI0035686B22
MELRGGLDGPLVYTNPERLPVHRALDRHTVTLFIVWTVVVLLTVLWLDRLGEGRTFFFDEWNFVVGRWRFEPDTFLAAHNGHLSIVPASVFYAMFELVGLDNYRAFRFLGLFVHVAVATAVLVYVRRRLGSLAGLGGGIAILLLGTGWQNILWPFQIGFMGSVLGFVLALLLLERRATRSDAAASACVAIALGCSGVGVAAAGAILVETLFTRPWRRWWIAIGPLEVYAVWYLVYGESQADLANLDAVPDYASTSGSAAVAGLYDLTLDWGRLGLGVLAGLAIAVLLHRRHVPARVLALVAMLGAFWGLTALSRGQYGDPGASRYIYVGAVVIVLLITELVPTRAARTVAVAGLVLGLLSAWATSDLMRAGAGGLRLEGAIIGAELGVIETLRDVVPADYAIDPVHAPGLTAGKYFEAVDGVGSSPAMPIQAFGSLSEFARTGADRVLFELAPPDISADVSLAGLCEATDLVQVDSVSVIEPGSTVVLQASDPKTVVSLGRWATPSFPVELGGTNLIVSFPDDEFGEQWTIATEFPDTRFCLAD